MSLWIYGINSIVAILEKRPKDVKEIVFIKTKGDRKESNERLVSIKETAKKYNIKTSEHIEEDAIERTKSKPHVNHQKVFALINPPQNHGLKDVVDNGKNKSNRVFLMLDGITDVHNIGAIIRTAVAFGVEAIILPNDRNVGITADVYKTSSGSIESIKVCTEVNLVRSVELLKENSFWVYGFEASGKRDLQQVDLKGNVCCIIGGEDTGIRRLLAENCDEMLRIPMSPAAQSLNASVSAGVVMYEVQRQRQFLDV